VSSRFNYTVFHNNKAPVIPVELWGRGRWHSVWVYVDTGASFTILHTFEAARLGVKLKNCKKFYIVTAGDRRIPVFISKLKMRIGAADFTAEVGFCRALGGTFNILGRQDVFNNFKVTFDDHREVISFHKNRAGGRK